MEPTISGEFDAWARRGAGPKMEEAHSYAGKQVLDRITLGYDQSFIDLGTGNGWAVRYIAERVPTIGLCVGVDASAEFVNEARRTAAGKYPVKFIHSAIEEIPFGEGSFDRAFSMEALYYAKEPLVALKSIWRVLKPRGTFHMVIDFYAENAVSKRWQEGIATPMHFLSQPQWVDLFEGAGFAKVSAERVLDERPIPGEMQFPWGGFNSREELEQFRTKVGSLLVSGTKGEFSRAMDPFMERAAAALAKESAQKGAGDARAPRAKAPRFSRRKA